MEKRKFDRIEEAYIIYLPTCTYCERRNGKNGLMNEKLNLCMDSEFWLRLGKRRLRFLEIPHKLAGSKMNADNKTLSARVKIHSQFTMS